MRNDLSIYRTYAANWWDGSQQFLRLLHNLVPARLSLFDEVIDTWHGETVLDLGCGGGFMAEALAQRGANVIGVDPIEAVASAYHVCGPCAETLRRPMAHRQASAERRSPTTASWTCVFDLCSIRACA